MLLKICYYCGTQLWGVGSPKFCPNCKKPWHEKTLKQDLPLTKSTPLFTTADAEKIKTGGRPMAKVKKTFKTPSGGSYTKMVESKADKKAKPKAKAKAKAPTTGAIQHKAYTYTTKKGKKVTVAAHTEKRRK